ncbi:small G protein signaling modulator 2-like [Petromyzon marinus]|uniref:small G protein signaling modulator 2-like n=1 Tax=Petromyzon marinus TaxID=7757 RepID=UPI003F6EE262
MEPPETVSELRQRLLKGVKKEVKQIMEEAVTRKFVHEDSSHIITFCASVESCLLHGLRRRAAGFLRSNKVAALFLKVGKSFPPASELCRRVQEMELLVESGSDSVQNFLSSLHALPQDLHNLAVDPLYRRASGREPMKRQTSAQKGANLSPQAIRHLWVRTALFEKVLDKVVLYLVENASVYYEKDALLADPVEGQLLASLLVGPCALEYTRMKTADHYWTDPSAQELVQRHRIHSPRGGRAESPSKRPTLHIKKRQSSAGSVSEDRPVTAARDYVESLHQSARNVLLYGKNNVLVQPRGDVEPVPGYLSLHQAGERLTLKWTPNQLMNGSSPDPEHEKNVLWDYAITVHLEHIVYIHCHQQPESGGTLVLVSQDGIQRPPIHFPRGGHLLSFLSCLESGLAPRGQLDPPLCTHMSTGAVFPPLRKRLGRSHASEEDPSPCPLDGAAVAAGVASHDGVPGHGDNGALAPTLADDGGGGGGGGGEEDEGADGNVEDEAGSAGTDYVFRIIYPGYRNDFSKTRRIPGTRPPGRARFDPMTPYGFNSTSDQCLSPLSLSPSPLTSDLDPFHLPSPKQNTVTINYHHLSSSCMGSQAESSDEDDEDQDDDVDEKVSDSWGAAPAARHAGKSAQGRPVLANRLLAALLPTLLWPFRPAQHVTPNPISQDLLEVQASNVALGSPGQCPPPPPPLWQTGEASPMRPYAPVPGVASPGSPPLPPNAVPAAYPAHIAAERTPLKSLCDNMRRQILSRAFFGWLAYCRHLSTVRTHLSALVNTDIVPADRPCDASNGLTRQLWAAMEAGTEEVSETEMVRLVYYGGVDPSVRHHVWPYLLGHYQLGMTASEKQQVDEDTRARFEDTSAVWRTCQAAVQAREREREALGGHGRHASGTRAAGSAGSPGGAAGGPGGGAGGAVQGVTARSRAASSLAALGRLSSSAGSLEARLLRFGAFGSSVSSESSVHPCLPTGCSVSAQVFESVDEVETHAGPEASTALQECLPDLQLPYAPGEDPQPGLETQDSTDTHGTGSHAEAGGSPWEPEEQGMLGGADEAGCHGDGEAVPSPGLGSPPSQPEPDSAVGDYTQEELDMYAMNFHRIDKDVHRCDRNFWFFTAGNLERLRRIMCSYVWEHLDVGYVQGMCDLLAPLLVILDDEVLAYSCFSQLMKRMIQNFPQGGAMDNHFANMRSLIQILDSEIFELMHRNGDYTHFFFCYRWFLLDFKRELVYEDVFAVWEAIWAARRVSSEHFVLFLALALVARYRDIILENNMDFTDIIRFFNEMAERHDARQLLAGARELVHRVQALIENK